MSFFSTDLMRLNPIPQPVNKEAKKRVKITPKRRAELLARKVIQSHDVSVCLEYMEGETEMYKTINIPVPATLTVNALMKKCQIEYFVGLGIKWDEDWRLFMDDEIPLPDSSEKQLWECDFEANV